MKTLGCLSLSQLRDTNKNHHGESECGEEEECEREGGVNEEGALGFP